MKKDWIGFAGVVTSIFGAFMFLSHSVDFSNFPLNLKLFSTLGLLIFIAGLAGMYYASR